MAVGLRGTLRKTTEIFRKDTRCWVHADYANAPPGQIRVTATDRARRLCEATVDFADIGQLDVIDVLASSNPGRWVATGKPEARAKIAELQALYMRSR